MISFLMDMVLRRGGERERRKTKKERKERNVWYGQRGREMPISYLVSIIAFLTLDKRQKLVMDHILNR